jgi:nucleoid-associated protein EbfC
VDPFDMGNMGALLGGFQQKAQEMREKAVNARYTGEAGGGLVKVVMTGDYHVQSVEIGEGAMGDRALLEDLVRAAIAESLRKVREEMERNLMDLTGGLPLPPGMLPI